ncbi:hypothetical protein Fmac_017824 [Flemingia macrophylla]|uniref:Uncharacterized protein n=1 Tax=Flemingia macrophylla TaxID=520843 RepID=A0ABD1M3W7_9FABA
MKGPTTKHVVHDVLKLGTMMLEFERDGHPLPRFNITQPTTLSMVKAMFSDKTLRQAMVINFVASKTPVDSTMV